MKRVVFASFTLCVILLMLLSCKPSGKAAARYNDKLVRHQQRIVSLQQELIRVFNEQRAAEMKASLDKFKSELTTLGDSVRAMTEFDGRDDFKKQTLNYFEELKKMADNECVNIVKLYELPDSLFTNNEEKKLEELRNTINAKTMNALKVLEEEQKKFAKEYNFEIGK